MWTDNIYGKASQCLALPPTPRTPGGTTNGAGHTGPIHQWTRARWDHSTTESSVLHLQSEEVPAFAFWPPGLVSFPAPLPSLP